MMFKTNYLISLIKNYKFNSLFVRNLILVFLLIVIPLNCICAFFYISTVNSSKQEIFDSTDYLTNSIKSLMDNEVNRLKYLAVNTALHQDTQNYILSSTETKNPDIENITQYIGYCSNMHKSIDSIYVYCKHNDTVLSSRTIINTSDFDDLDWLEDYNQMGINDIKIVLRKRNDIYPYYLSIIKPIPLSHNNNLGCIVINVNIQRLTDTFKNNLQSAEQNIYILTNEQKILYHDTPGLITQPIGDTPFVNEIASLSLNSSQIINFDGNRFVVSSASSQFFDWNYYSATPMSFYNEKFREILFLVIWLVIASLVIAVILSLYISFKTFLPINNIIELIESPEKWMEDLYTDPPKNETAYIMNWLSNILHLNKKFETELNDRLILLRHTQTAALQSQINPHFLYNILDNINWMAVDLTEGENDVSKSIILLANLFKFNIDNANYLTTLSEELAYTKNYVEILNIRYKNQINVHWKIDNDTIEHTIPRFILQPIIENAVYHGIKPKDYNGNIVISSKVQNKNLVITIFDDGVGIDRNTLTQINQEFSEVYVSSEKHIGLKNVNQRIKLIYGDKYGVKLKSKLNFGTTVVITLPIILK